LQTDWFYDYNSMIKKIDYYLERPDYRITVERHGRKLIEKRHTYEVRAIEMYPVFKKIVRSKSAKV